MFLLWEGAAQVWNTRIGNSPQCGIWICLWRYPKSEPEGEIWDNSGPHTHFWGPLAHACFQPSVSNPGCELSPMGSFRIGRRPRLYTQRGTFESKDSILAPWV